MADVHGNRGLCAQACRLPYSLYNKANQKLDEGFLLSPSDLCGVKQLPDLIKAGVTSFKIEGRLKNPEYVAAVTRFYRKYIDLVYDNINLSNDELYSLIDSNMNIKNKNTRLTDYEELLQSFNRGGFSTGHLKLEPNKNLIYKNKSNNSGFYLGKVEKFNHSKGYITLKANCMVGIGDKIGIDSDIYTISELMVNNENKKLIKTGDIITIGRIKGDIKPGVKVYRLQSKLLNDDVSPTFNEDKEFKKIKINGKIIIKKKWPIEFAVTGATRDSIYFGESANSRSIIPLHAQKQPLTDEKIIAQLSKTGNTWFEFENIDIIKDNDLFVPISDLNEIRRVTLEKLSQQIIKKHILSRKLKYNNIETNNTHQSKNQKQPTINLLIYKIDNKFDYTALKNVDKLYIPLRFFVIKKYREILLDICKKQNVYLYMPNFVRDSIKIDYDRILNDFKINGIVISNLSQVETFKKYKKELIGNYTLNVFNAHTLDSLNEYGIKEYIISPELNDEDTNNLISNSNLPCSLMVYGRIPLMTLNYCLLGKSNKCYSECDKKCALNNEFILRDRLKFDFKFLPDTTLGLTTIYNSKITSFDYSNFNVSSVQVTVLEEKPEDIQNIIDMVKNKKCFEGSDYCGHFNKYEK